MTGGQATRGGADRPWDYFYLGAILILVVVILLGTYIAYPSLNPVVSAVVAVIFTFFVSAWFHFQIDKRVVTVGDKIGYDIEKAATKTLETIAANNDTLTAATKDVLVAIEATHKSIKSELPK